MTNLTSFFSIDTTTGVISVSSSVTQGTKYETVTATDSLNVSKTTMVTFNIAAAMTFTGFVAPAATQGTTTLFGSLNVAGGTGTKSYSIAGQSNVTINSSTGAITVTTGLSAGSYPETITVTDSVGATSKQIFTLVIAAPIALTAGTNITTTQGRADSSTAVSKTGGTGTLRYSLASYATGITIDTTTGRVLVSALALQGHYDETIIATDSAGATGSVGMTIDINGPIVVIGGNNITTTFTRGDTTVAFTASGGTGTLTLRKTSTNAAIIFDTATSTLRVTGALTAGSYIETIVATDSLGVTGFETVTIVVASPITIAGRFTESTTVGFAYTSVGFTASNGTGTKTFTITPYNQYISIDSSTGAVTIAVGIDTGTYNESVTATDSLGVSTSVAMNIVVNQMVAIGGGSDITTTVGVAKSSTAFTSTLGTGTKRYSLNPVATGISVDSITGIVTVASTKAIGTDTISVVVTDSVGATASKQIVIRVNTGIVISGGSNITTTFGRADSTTAFTATGGTGTLTFSLPGSIAGMSIDQQGVVRVTGAVAANSYTETVTVTDSAGATSFVNMTILINAAITVGGGGLSGAVAPVGTLNFNTCSTSGRIGPTACPYSGTPLAGNVTVVSGIQYWTVPVTGTYTIEAAGAKGGNGNGGVGGAGAKMKGTFNLVAGEVIRILVGQPGGDHPTANGGVNMTGGGGGGTFVVRSPFNTNSAILVVAGGGGGSGSSVGGGSGQITTSGQAGLGSGSGAGGINGGGGGGAISGAAGTATTAGGEGSSCSFGTGGSGFFTKGGRNCSGTAYAILTGESFVNGGVGGVADSSLSTTSLNVGGFGGGAGSGHRSPGGGGYSGGGGDGAYTGGGGGGSYNSGTSQANTAGANSGSGYVTITSISQAVNPTQISTTSGIQFKTPPFTSSGGTGGKTFSIAPAISGISIDANTGVLTIDSSVVDNTYYETITVTDSLGTTGLLGISIVVNPAMQISGLASLSTTYGTTFSSPAYTVSGGTTPKQFSLTPTISGITVDSITGIVSLSSTLGSASTTTIYYETIVVTDTVGATALLPVTITVNPRLVISGPSTMITTYSRADTSTSAYSVTGGTGTIRFSIAPTVAGISIDTLTGYVYLSSTLGSSSAQTLYTETVTATDSVGATSTKVLRITVNKMIAFTGGSDIYTTLGVAGSSLAYGVTGGTGATSITLTTSTTGVTFDTTTYIVTVDSSPVAGVYWETLTARDSLGVSVIKVESITVNPAIVISAGSSIITTVYTAKSSTAFVATLGTGTKTWSLRGPPTGFTVNATSGVVTVDSTVAVGSYTLTLRATDSVTAYTETSVAVTVNDSIAISAGTDSITTTRGRAAYSPAFTAANGTGTLRFSITPTYAGISIDTWTGVVTVDSATAVNLYLESVTVTDSAGSVAKVALRIRVNQEIAVSGPTTFATTVTIPRSTDSFTAVNGTGALTLSMAGTVNAGITFDPVLGKISLDGTVQPGTYYETITATDSIGVIGTRAITITVNSAIVIDSGSAINTTFGTARTSGSFRASNGTGVKTFTISPTISGITIDSVTGNISVTGAVGQADTRTIIYETITATDTVGAVGTYVETITINPIIVISEGQSRIVTTRGLARTTTPFVAKYGTGTLTFSLGTPYTGLSIDQSGVVTVAANTAAATYYESVTVTDSVSSVSRVGLTIVVNPEIKITGQDFTVGTNGLTFSVQNIGTPTEPTSSTTFPLSGGSACYGPVTVPNLDYNWGGGKVVLAGVSDVPCNPDFFATYATGYIQAPVSGNVYFCSINDDQFKLFINGSAVITSWSAQGDNPSCNSQGVFTGAVAGTWYPITVWMHEDGGGAVEKLWWSTTGASGYSAVPQSALRTAASNSLAPVAIQTTITIPLTSVAYSSTGGTDTITYSMTPNISGITFDTTTRKISVDGTLAANTYYETIVATDSLGQVGTQMVSIIVNPAITISSGSNINTTYGIPLSSSAFNSDTGTGTGKMTYTLSPTISGITIDSVTGIVSVTGAIGVADTTTLFYETVTATDSVGAVGSKAMIITVNPRIVISAGDTSLVTTRGRAEYSKAFVATYGTGTKRWSISPTVTGIGIDATTGIVTVDSATAYRATAYLETVTATDSVGATTLTTISILVNQEIAVTGGSNILTTTRIRWSSQPFVSANGTGVRYFSLAPVISGITIDSVTGVVTVIETMTPAVYSETVVATDVLGVKGYKAMTITVASALVFTGGSPINTTYGIPLSSTAFVAINGTQTRTYAIAPSNPYISINQNTGVVTAAVGLGDTNTLTTYLETITATDSVGATVDTTIVITINPKIMISGGDTYVVTTNTLAKNSTPFVATYGTGTLTFAITPTYSGIQIGANGVVTIDSSTTANTYYESVVVTDSVGATARVPLTILVNPRIVITGFAAASPQTGSFQLSGSNSQYLSVPANAGLYFGTDSFTVEGWFKLSNVTASQQLWMIQNGNAYFMVNIGQHGGTGKMSLYWNYTPTTGDPYNFVDSADNAFTANVWNHVVAMRNGNTYSLYLNGKCIATASGVSTYTMGSSALPMVIGANSTGFISNFRVVKGSNVYTAGTTVGTTYFTSPTSPLTNITGTSLLLSAPYGSGFLKDGSSSNLTIGNVGSVVTASDHPFTGLQLPAVNLIYTTITIPQTSVSLSNSGGTGSMTFSMSPTNLQGISFNPTSRIITADSTTPAGTYLETITAVDSLGAVGSQQFTVIVNTANAFITGSNINTTYGIPLSSSAFTATNGTGAKRYTLSPVISGITIDLVTGIVSATGAIGNSATQTIFYETVTVTDSVGATADTSVVITVNPSIIISGGQATMVTTRGLAIRSETFTATNGTGTKRWSISPPVAGITIDTWTGVVTVAATTIANNGYLETITATDSVGAIATVNITIRVNPEIAVSGGSGITTTSGIQMSSTAFTAANGSTAANGGTGTYTFSLTPTIQYIRIDSATGIVTVETSLAAGTYYETVVATDTLGQSGTKAMTILVNAKVQVSAGSNITTTYGIARSSTAFTSSLGTGTRSFTVTDTSTGYLSISASGVVTVDSSTPPGIYYETVTATDTVGAIGIKAFTVYVNETLTITGGSNVLTTVGRADTSTAFAGVNGTPAYTYSISPDYSSSGISIDSVTGVVRVTANATPGFYTETVTVTDSVSARASKVMTVRVNAGVTVSAGSNIITTTGIARSSQPFSGSGGTTAATFGSGAFTYSLTPVISGITIDTVTGVITVDSTVAGSLNAYVETVVATDSLGLKGYVQTSITVNLGIVVSAGSDVRTTTGHMLKSSAFAAANGTSTKYFSIYPGESGITIDSVTGVITVDSSTPFRTYYETVTATDSVGATGFKTLTIYVADHVVIGGGSNILTTKGRAESSTAFTATNGTATFRYSISPTITGISVDSITGVVRVGTNALEGIYIETVTVTDSVTDQSSTTLTIQVNDAVSVTGGSDITTTFGIARSSTAFQGVNGTTIATGGTGNFVYSLTRANSHISVDPVTGVVTVDSSLVASATPYVETVVATDELGQKGYKAVSILVNAAVTVTNGSGVTTSRGVGLASTAFTANNGTGTKVFTISPTVTGITIDSVTGVVYVDTETAIGTYYETVTATDQVGAIGIAALTVLVNAPVGITGGSNVTSTFGSTVSSSAFARTNGTGPWRFTISPTITGITIDSVTGIVTVGATAQVGTWIETVTVTDKVGSTSSTTMTIYVNQTMQFTGGSNITTTMGRAVYSSAFGATNGTTLASNGTGAYKFSIDTITVTPNWAVTLANSGITIDSVTGIVRASIGVRSNQETYTVTIRVTDDVGSYTTTTMKVYLNKVVVMTSVNSKFSACNFCTTAGNTRNLAPLTATLGTAPYSFALSPNHPGITIDSLTGVITIDASTPVGTYRETATVTDAVGATSSISLLFYVNSSLVAPNVSAGMITTRGIAMYSDTLTTTGGSGAVQITVSPNLSSSGISLVQEVDGDGLPLPARIYISASATPGTYYETITATDRLGFTDVSVMQIIVNQPITVSGGGNVITTVKIRQVTPAFTYTGGSISYVMTMAPTLPGITLDPATGIVTVESTTPVGFYTETITVTDSVGATGYKVMTIRVWAGIVVSGGSNVITTQGAARSSNAFTFTGGTTPFVFSIASADETTTPAGITINPSTGVVTVDSTVAQGTYYETITVTDSVGATGVIRTTILVNPPLSISQNKSTVITTYGRADTSTVFSYGGGTTPWRFTYANASNGLSITGVSIDSTTGRLTIASTVVAGTYDITVSVTDSISVIASISLHIVVNDSITVYNGGDIVTTSGIAKYSTAFLGSGGTTSNTTGGVRALSFSLLIPHAGISIDTDTGIIYIDSSTAPAIWYDTVIATDSLGVTGAKAVKIVINSPLAITNGSNITTTNGIARSSDTFTVTYGTVLGSGGTSQYSFAITGDTPEKFAIDTITYVGNVTSSQTFKLRALNTLDPGTYYETITITDNVGETATTMVRVLVNDPIRLFETTSVMYTTTGRAITWDSTWSTGGTTWGTSAVKYSIVNTGGISSSNETITVATGAIYFDSNVAAGDYTLTIRATDSVGATADETMTLHVNGAVQVSGGQLTLTTTQGITVSSPVYLASGGTWDGEGRGGATGKRLEFTLNVTSNGGATNISAIRIDTSTLNQATIIVDSSVTSNSSSVPGIYYETITITDSLGMKKIVYETVVVYPVVQITNGSNITTTQGIARSSDTFTVSYGSPYTKQGGTGQYSFAITGDSNTLFAIDTFTFTASSPRSLTFKIRAPNNVPFGTYNETITVTGNVGDTAVVAVRIVVNDIIRISQLSNIYTTRGRADSSTTIVATGGTSPIKYAFSPASTDTYVTIDSVTGRVSVGKLAAVQNQIYTIVATDSVSATASETITIRVNAALSVSGGTQNIYTTQGIAQQSSAYVGAGGTINGTGGTGVLNYSIVSTPATSAITIDSVTGIVYVSTAITSADSLTTQIYCETITVTDSLGETTTVSETITVNPLPTAVNGSNIITTKGVGRSSSIFTSRYGTVTGRGGTGNYSYSITGATGDQAKFSIYTIDTNTFQVRVDTTTTPGVYVETVTITDSVGATGQITLTVTVNDIIRLTETSSVAYSTYGKQIIWNSTQSTGGTPFADGPVHYTLTNHPSVGSHGVINQLTGAVTFDSTTPVGSWLETITATDSVGATAVETMTITFNESVTVSGGTLNIYTSQGIAQQSLQYVAIGGTWDTPTRGGAAGTRLEFTLNVTSNLGLTNPATIRLDTATLNKATIFVDPSIVSKDSSTPGIYYETLTITDSLGMKTYAYETITVNPEIRITGGSNIITTTGIQISSDTFTAQFGTASGSGGTGNYTFAISGDSTTIFAVDTSNYVSSATPSIKFRFKVLASAPAGIYNETVTITDSVGESATVAIQVTVNVRITLQETSTILYTTIGKANSWAFTSYSGGTAPVTFSLATGARNAVLNGHDTMTTNGIVGTLSIDSSVAAGTYVETITATDSVSSTTIETVTIVVNALPKIDSGTANIYTTQGIGTQSAAYVGSLGTWSGTGGTGRLEFTLNVTSNGATGTGAIRLDTSTLNQAIVIIDSSIVSKDSVTNGIYYETITITDSLGMKTYAYETITVNPVVRITAGSNIITTNGVARYSDTFTVNYGTVLSRAGSGGATNYTFAINGNQSWFKVETLTTTTFRVKVDSTTPAATYFETVTVTDAVGETGVVGVTVLVNDSITLTETATIIYTTFGKAATWNSTTARGGTTPLVYSITGRSVAMTGHDTITASTGAIYFDSTTPVGRWVETVTAIDSVGATAWETMTLVVNPAITFTGGSNIITTFGIQWLSDTLTALGGTTALTGGLGILNLNLTGTANASYVSFDTNTGRITALPTLPVGVYYETVTATDFVGINGIYLMTITVDSLAAITGNSVINTTFDTGSVTIWSFSLGTGPLNAKVTGSFAPGITWDTATAGTAKLTIGQFMPLGTLFETITVTDSVGATTVKAITLNFLKGNRSLTETSLATTIKYGDTTTTSGIGYPNGNACVPIITFDGGFTVVQFKNTGACNWAIPAGVTQATVLTVGGGGAGGVGRGGGGGAGGFVKNTISVTPLSILSIYVGKGGAALSNVSGDYKLGNGETSTFATQSAAGGGVGGSHPNNYPYPAAGQNGASGGGAGMNYTTLSWTGGLGIAGQGYAGSASGPVGDTNRYTGGGGGAAHAGYVGSGGNSTGTAGATPDGGEGLTDTITGAAISYAGGGGGAIAIAQNGPGTFETSYNSSPAGIGKAGGGNGGAKGQSGADAAANTGSGGGGGGAYDNSVISGAGGSGIVVVRFATPAPYVAPIVDGNLTYRTTTSSVCSVDTSTGAVSAYGSIGTCSIVADVAEGVYYNAESATINITVGKADTITVTSYVTPNSVSFTNAMAAISETFSVIGLKALDTITGVAKPVTYNFSAGATCATGGTCTLGQTGPGGGIVFYDAGSTQTWGRYLEIAPSTWNGTDTATSAQWCSTTNKIENAGLTGIGDGLTNTLMATSDCASSPTNAIYLARNYAGGSFSDWHLPSINEAQALYPQDTLTGISMIANYYWLSNEVDTTNANIFSPISGAIISNPKSNTVTARPIRAFDSSILASTMDTPTNAGKYTVLPSALTLANSKPLTNYQAVVYVSDTNTGKFTVNKISQPSALTIDPVEFATFTDSITLISVGGSSSRATTFRLTSLGSTATGCALNGNKLSASSIGICRVYAVKPADVNYYATVAPVISVRFDTFTARIVVTLPLGGGNMIITGGAPVLDTSTPIPVETLSVNGFTPTSGTAGTTITITGTGFIGAGFTLQSIRIGRNLTNVPIKSIVNNTTITAVVDTASSSGRITVTFSAPNSQTVEFVSAGGIFSFTPPTVASAPTISSFTPTSGTAGTSITLTGSYFNGTTRVTIGGTQVDSYTVNSDSSLTITSAVGSASGTIAVTNAAGTGASSGSFTAYNLAPIITLSSSSVTADSVTAVNISVTGNSGSPAVSYNLIGTLPLGLSFNSSTGAITGTPQEAHATSTYTVQAINPVGTGTASFTLTTSY